jgi:hypothetical protein
MLRCKLLINMTLMPDCSAELLGSSHTAGVWIVRSTAGDRKHADFRDGDFVLGGGGGGLGGSNCSGEDESDDEGANEMFHSGIPLKLYSQKKISLDKPDEVTIGYIME